MKFFAAYGHCIGALLQESTASLLANGENTMSTRNPAAVAAYPPKPCQPRGVVHQVYCAPTRVELDPREPARRTQ